jgi:hypothetical protein
MRRVGGVRRGYGMEVRVLSLQRVKGDSRLCFKFFRHPYGVLFLLYFLCFPIFPVFLFFLYSLFFSCLNIYAVSVMFMF